MRVKLLLAISAICASSTAFSASATEYCNGEWCVDIPDPSAYQLANNYGRNSYGTAPEEGTKPFSREVHGKDWQELTDVDLKDMKAKRYGETGSKVSEHRNWDAMVGVSAGTLPEYIGGNQLEVTILPFVIGRYRLSKNSELRLNPFEGLAYSLSLFKGLEVGVGATIREGRDSADDHEHLSGMPDIDDAVEAGPWIKLKPTKNTYIRAQMNYDLAGGHEGRVMNVEVGYNRPISRRLHTGFAIRGLMGDNKYMSAYYDVTASQATSTRPQFNAEKGMAELGARAHATYWASDSIFARTDLFYTRFLGDAADSPLSSTDNQVGALVSVGYRF